MSESQPPMLPGLRAAVRASRARGPGHAAGAEPTPAETDPVASVLLDIGLAHLDRDFDYLVPEELAERAVVGARVKVRFAGKDVDGFITARRPATEHGGRLAALRKVVSSEPVLSAEIVELSRTLADRYAGQRCDVIRLAVPPRHARAESAVREESTTSPQPRSEADSAVGDYPAGSAFLAHLAAGRSPRAVWNLAPGTVPAAIIAAATSATLASGRGVLICLPDRRDVTVMEQTLSQTIGTEQFVVLQADAGPERRYREFLKVSRGEVRVVVGTRSAAFAPVRDLGLVVICDDGDDLYAEPRAPYCHTREVLLTRAQQQDTAALLIGFARSVEAQHLVQTGWAHEVLAPRERLRAAVRVDVVEAAEGPIAARIPHRVHQVLRNALTEGAVLVTTPRSGYLAALACEGCRRPPACQHCAGPLRIPSPTSLPQCRWCGREQPPSPCPACGHRGLRAPVVGETRTAEELGRSFPGVRVISSGGDRVKDRVEPSAGIVVATLGAEPAIDGGYAAVILLDTWLTLAREDMRVEEEALRRWMRAAGQIRPGGHVLLVGAAEQASIQALVRWDPGGFAAREAELRAQAHLPPAARIATLTGAPGAIDDALTVLSIPEGTDVLGPVEVPDNSLAGRSDRQVQVVLRTPFARRSALSAALLELQRVRSARKLDPIRVQVDPVSV